MSVGRTIRTRFPGLGPPRPAPERAAPDQGRTGPGRRLGRLSRGQAFWLVGVILILLLLSSSAPSPMYVLYQQRWHFSGTALTVVFGIYAVAVLVALLLFGSLSDTLGRRRVLLASLVGEVVSMALFIGARNLLWLLAARAVQGLAVGLATGATSAALIELSPPAAPSRGTLLNSAGPTGGIAAGALVAGLLVQFAPAPTVLTYALLLAAFLLAFVGVLAMPETAPGQDRGHQGRDQGRDQGRGLRIRPSRISVPAAARRPFALLSLALIAVWAVCGLYLSLGPSIALQILHTGSLLTGGLVVALFAGVATVGQLWLGGLPPLRLAGTGVVALLVGLALVHAALTTSHAVLFFLGTAALGFGWGTAFLGAFRALAALAEPARRSELLAAVYVVAYLSMSVPAVAAGGISGTWGLHRTALTFITAAAFICVAALLGLCWMVARNRARRGARGTPGRK
ncbi:MFS transporter [Streptomyces nitrosporeus]|uniref:MFS transporter n=1 Tax=Streptomyces nitrosporeus TaxID=28894 RepID=A0A5J6FBX1_9ACTN|nr:MFS transporter [Streptomyces nitrosporeus]QEU73513.1 MFS transporter [Streptomyces nitrosporeus]GGZ04036.1 MFS transporter [Streptomyces nitrosporeus]